MRASEHMAEDRRIQFYLDISSNIKACILRLGITIDKAVEGKKCDA
jgi:hypothetical protein